MHKVTQSSPLIPKSYTEFCLNNVHSIFIYYSLLKNIEFVSAAAPGAEGHEEIFFM